VSQSLLIHNLFQPQEAVAKRGSKKVRPIYEDNKDCVLLYACGWSEYTSLPSNSHIKYNCPGRREYTSLPSNSHIKYNCPGRRNYTSLPSNSHIKYNCSYRGEYISLPSISHIK
jgi:hypothetical protein